MDPLARWLNLKMSVGQIRGLKLAPSAPPMACSLFSDDLILTGTLSDPEIEEFRSTLMSFFSFSGLMINSSKSKVWFSVNSDDHHKAYFRSRFDVQDASPNETYLGCPVVVSGRASFDYLVDRFEKRLNLWKAKKLSHAGRLVLIKSVLESLPVYAMGTVLILTRVLKKLTAIMRNFFWGAEIGKKHMAYVAWSKITLPKGMGGLGLRNLKEMNMALVVKIVWKLAEGAKAPWATTLIAKYCPHTGFWLATGRNSCTMLWRNIIVLKPLIRHHIAWKIGDGSHIPVFSQPWYPGWELNCATNAEQRNLKVSSLILHQSGGWDFERLQSLLGFQLALQISFNEVVQPAQSPAPDTLLFTHAKDGKFTVKKAYQLFKGDTGNLLDKGFWTRVWKAPGLLPKLKLFIWRCVAGALPVQGIIGSRITSVTTACKICNQAPESIEHMLFTCDFSRAAWLASPLSMRSGNMQGTFREIMEFMFQTLSDLEIVKLLCMMWAVWRVRNDAVMGGIRQSMFTCSRYYNETLLAYQPLYAAGLKALVPDTNQSRVICLNGSALDPVCFADGSWSADGLAGIGLYILINGKVVQWVSKPVQTINPAHVEAIAVLQGYKMLNEYATGKGIVYSDSLETVDALAHKQPKINDWRSFHVIWEAWQMQTQGAGKLRAQHVNREHQGLHIAHLLANWGRREGRTRMEREQNLSTHEFHSTVIGRL